MCVNLASSPATETRHPYPYRRPLSPQALSPSPQAQPRAPQTLPDPSQAPAAEPGGIDVS